MPIPLTAILDEAADICKLEDLPRRYSHSGSRGIILITSLRRILSSHQSSVSSTWLREMLFGKRDLRADPVPSPVFDMIEVQSC